MAFSPLYYPIHPSHSPHSPGSSQYPTSSSGTHKCHADGWNLAVDCPGLYNDNQCSPETSGSAAASSFGDLNGFSEEVPASHPLLQACAASSSTASLTSLTSLTSLNSLTHVRDLSTVTPPITHPGSVSYLIPNTTEPEKSQLGYSPYSQPSESINFLKKAANAITPAALIKLLEEQPLNVLLFDIRSDQDYAAGFICQAINVPIPMRKLKKTSFTLDRMIANFVPDEDLEEVAKWDQVGHIVVYDNDSDGQSGVAGSATFYLLEKFIQEGWEGQAYVLEGEYTSINRMIHKN